MLWLDLVNFLPYLFERQKYIIFNYVTFLCDRYPNPSFLLETFENIQIWTKRKKYIAEVTIINDHCTRETVIEFKIIVICHNLESYKVPCSHKDTQISKNLTSQFMKHTMKETVKIRLSLKKNLWEAVSSRAPWTIWKPVTCGKAHAEWASAVLCLLLPSSIQPSCFHVAKINEGALECHLSHWKNSSS